MAQDRIRNTEEIQKSADRKKLIERRMDEFKHGKQDIVCDYDDYNELKELIEENGWSRSYVNAIKGYIQVGDNIPTDEELSSVVVREQYIKLLRQLVRKRLGQATAGFILAALFVSLTIGIAKHAPKCSSDEPVKKDEPTKVIEPNGSSCSGPKKEAQPKEVKPVKEKKVSNPGPGCSGPKKEATPKKEKPKKVKVRKVKPIKVKTVTESQPGCSGPKIKQEEEKQEKPVVVKQAPKKPESKYVDGAVEDARRILNIWYPGKHNQKLLEARIQSIKAWAKANGKDIEPCRFLLAAHNAGARTPDNNRLYAGDSTFIHSGGNHKVFGAKWIKTVVQGGYVGETYARNSALIRALANSIRGDSVITSDDAINGFWLVDPYIGFGNQIGYVPNAPYFDDGVLPNNATHSSNLVFYNNKGHNKVFTTYAVPERALLGKFYDDTQLAKLGIANYCAVSNFRVKK